MKFRDFLKENDESNTQVSLSSSLDQIDKSKIKNQVIKAVTNNGFKYLGTYVTDISNDEITGFAAYSLINHNENYKENSGDKSELRYVYRGSYKYTISSNKVVDFDESTQRYETVSELDSELKNSDAIKL